MTMFCSGSLLLQAEVDCESGNRDDELLFLKIELRGGGESAHAGSEAPSRRQCIGASERRDRAEEGVREWSAI